MQIYYFRSNLIFLDKRKLKSFYNQKESFILSKYNSKEVSSKKNINREIM